MLFFLFFFLTLLLCNLILVQPISWFGFNKKKEHDSSSSKSTRDKLKYVLSLYSSPEIPSPPTDLQIQADKWSTKREEENRQQQQHDTTKSNGSGSGEKGKAAPRNPLVRKYSSRRPMDGASFNSNYDSGAAVVWRGYDVRYDVRIRLSNNVFIYLIIL